LEYIGEKFARYDTNADGVIEAEEVQDKGTDRRAYYQRRRLHVLDTNKDGTISKDEFLAGPKERFALMDLDDDGAITADNLPPRMARRWKEKTSK
jgi:Ca2+-binding EF-hand superfamily protein